MTDTPAAWPNDIFTALKALDVRQVAYVPDAGHTRLIEMCLNDNSMRAVPLTTEEDGVAMLAGTWLGGERGVLLMQSSGIGNCVNMFSTLRVGRYPLLTLVTMRGQWGEANPWQLPMGQNAAAILKLSGFQVHELEHAEMATDTIAASGRTAFEANHMVAVLISQRLIGSKAFAPAGGN
jgi:sulfopyruvate decarboxylase alpha subunit